jgi:hypothetical protein
MSIRTTREKATEQDKCDMLRKLYAGLLLGENPYQDRNHQSGLLDPHSRVARLHRAAHDDTPAGRDEVVKILKEIDSDFDQVFTNEDGDIDRLYQSLTAIVRNIANREAAPYIAAPSAANCY